MKIFELVPVFVDEIPNNLEEGKLYVSEMFELVIHLCACGCKQKVVTPLGHNEWSLNKENGITLRPSIGNFIGENPYHAHYYITNNMVEWL